MGLLLEGCACELHLMGLLLEECTKKMEYVQT